MRLNGTREVVETEEYPTTTEEFVERHGDHEIELEDGTETVGDVLERVGPETYEGPEDVRLTLYSGVSQEAVGRVGYSDRDAAPPGSPVGPDQLSF